MKIAHLVAHSALNGVATSTRTLIDQQLLAGHEVFLVHRADSWIEKQTFHRPVPMLGTSFETRPAELRRVGEILREWGADVVHAHGARANKYAMIFRLAARAPAVMTAHARLFQLPWMFAHDIVGLSQQTTDYYTARWLARRKNIHVVPNMFDVAAFLPVTPERRAALRAELGLRPDAVVLGSVGDLCGRKNQIDMVRVLKRLVPAVDAELLLIGSTHGVGEMRGWEAALSDPVLLGRVHVLGRREDATRLLGALDVFLLTSRTEEAPIAPLEAMAQAIPVLSTEVGNMPDLLPPSQLFTLGDTEAMAATAKRLADDPAAAALAGAAERQTILDKLAPSRILPRIEAIYRSAMAKSGRAPAKAGD